MSLPWRAHAVLWPILVLASLGRAEAGAFDRFVTANGIEVVLIEDHSRALVAGEGCFRGGARTEAPEHKGLSHFYEHLIGRGGTRRQPLDEWRQARSRLDFAAHTGPDGVCFSFRVPREDLDEAVWRFADAVFALELDEEAIDRERGVVLQELNRGRDMPFGYAYHQLFPAAFTRHPYRTMTIGLEEVIRSVDLEGLRTFYRDRFRTNHFFLAVVGDFERGSLRSTIATAFGDFEPGPASFGIGEPEPRQESFRVVASPQPVETSQMLLGCKVPAAVDPDAAVVRVLAALLETRLREALAGEEGAAGSAWARAGPRYDPALLEIGLMTGPGDEETVWVELWEEMLRLAREGPNDEETARVREALATAADYARDSYSSYAFDVAAWELRGSFALADLFPRRLAVVTPDEVRQAAIRYLPPSRCTLSLIHPEGTPEPQLREEAARIAGVWPALASKDGVASLERLDLRSGPETLVKTIMGSGIQALHLLFPRHSAASNPSVRMVAARVLPRLGPDPLGEVVEAAGGRLEVNEGPDWLEIGLSAPADRFDPLVRGLGRVLRLRVLPKDAVAFAKRESAAALALRAQRAENQALDRLGLLLYGARHPYGRRAIAGEIEAVSAADLVTFFTHELDPGSAVVAFVGPADTARARHWLQGYEASSGTLGGSRAPWPSVTPSDERRSAVRRELTQVKVALGFAGVAAAHADYPALRLTTRILWRRLFYTFVRGERDPIAYRLLASFRSGLGPRPIVVEAGVTPGSEQRLIDRALAEAGALCQDGPSGGELAHVAGVISRRLFLDADSSAAEAELLAQYMALGVDGADLRAVGDRYRFVTPAEVQAVACRYLTSGRSRVAIVGPLEDAGD